MDKNVHLYIYLPIQQKYRWIRSVTTRAIVHAERFQSINYHNTRDATGRVLAAANFFPEWGLFAAYLQAKAKSASAREPHQETDGVRGS